MNAHTFALPLLLLILSTTGCIAEAPTGGQRAALMDFDGDPWEPGGGGGDPGGGGGGGGGGDWIPTGHYCWGTTCSFSFVRPAGTCTDAQLFGPGCAAAIAAWNANWPDSPGAFCLGGVYGCAAPGERTPCATSACEMRIAVTNTDLSCNTTTRPCPPDFTCDTTTGNCHPNCDPQSGDQCSGGYCNPDTHQCDRCDGPGDCDGDLMCVDGRCIETCDPENPGTCSRGTCDPTTMRCVACVEGGCPGTQVCDPNSGRCRPVESCGASTGGGCSYGRCIDDVCKACPTDFECTGSEVCNRDTGTCTTGCVEGERCLYEEQQCIDGVCRKPCTSDSSCDRTEYCEGYCRPAHPDGSGRCPRANMVANGAWCYAPCSARHAEVCGTNMVCDPSTGDCEIQCGTETIPTCSYSDLDTCYMGMCIPKCDPRITPCTPPSTCTYDDADNPICTGGCTPGDCRCSGGCPGGGTCNPDTGMCDGGFDPCAGVWCPDHHVCNEGTCQFVPECTWDFDCSFDDVCEYGVCVYGGHVDVCAQDGACTAGETCSCEPWCCGSGGGGGDGGGTGPGGSCGWDGGPSISYGDCHACGGRIEWGGDGYYCADLSFAL